MRQEKNVTHTDLHEFSSLESYGIRRRFLIRAADLLIYCLISLIGKSLRFESMRGWQAGGEDTPESFEKYFEKMRPCVMAFWHDRIFLTTYYWRRDDAAVMVSKSSDGEYIARVAQRFGFGVVRGSSSRGGSAALLKMIGLTKEGTRMALTVDGPRGPRHKAKSGAIILAHKTGIPVVPLLAEAEKVWILKSWDRTLIPRPFSRAIVLIGEPVYVPADANEDTLEEKRVELERKLDELVERGKEWRVAKKISFKQAPGRGDENNLKT